MDDDEHINNKSFIELFIGRNFYRNWKKKIHFFFNPLRLCLLLFVIKYRDTNYKRNFKSSDIKMKDIPSKS